MKIEKWISSAKLIFISLALLASEGDSVRVRLSERSIPEIRPLMGEPMVEDTAGIDRASGTLTPSSWPAWQRWRFAHAWLRLRVLPSLDAQSRVLQMFLQLASRQHANVRWIAQDLQRIVKRRFGCVVRSHHVHGHHASARPEHARHLPDRGCRVEKVMQRRSRHHDVELGILERQSLSPPGHESHVLQAGRRTPLLGFREHFGCLNVGGRVDL